MGDWMRVSLRGTIAPEDIPAAVAFLTPNDDYSNWGPLTYTPGLCSLGQWVTPEICMDGNLSERNYSVDEVAVAFRGLVAAAPSLTLKVHCGGPYESEECVATLTVADGEVSVGGPEVGTVPGVSDEVFQARVFGILGGSR